MSSDDSDDEVLANLMANTNDDDDNDTESTDVNSFERSKPTILKELDYNFIDGISNNFVDETQEVKPLQSATESVSLIDDHANSSDEEDRKYFEKQQYSEYGKEIKNLLKNKETENVNFKSSLKTENSYNNISNSTCAPGKSNSFTSKTENSSLPNSYSSLIQKSVKNSLQTKNNSNTNVKKDVYSDPIFGLKIIRPLISSTELIEKMQGRKAVTVSNVKIHLTNQSVEKLNDDWVIAGVLLNKSLTKTSQKGNQYCIWKITDLSADMKTVSVFLFSSAYKNFWKISSGSVVGILNPSVLESRDDKDLATLSVNNAQKILILGFSRDLGKCKSVKKNGEPCTAPVNLSTCEYCIYHIKQEYGKYSRRSELQSTSLKRAFGNFKDSSKKPSVTQQRHPDALPFIAIPAKRNEALYKKDCERLALLRGDKSMTEKKNINFQTETKLTETKLKSTGIEISTNQTKKDFDRLNKLRKWSEDENILNPVVKEEKQFKLPIPKLGNGVKGGIIDFSKPVPKDLINKAKLTAIEWVKNNGSIKKSNPNQIRPEKQLLQEKGIKRKREEKEENTIVKKNESENIMKKKFLEMMEKKSVHCDLIENREGEELEEYFKKGESKERLEKKMLETYQIDCKAVYCKVCKYTAFSSSELCKKLQHPIKVINAVKKFFKCTNCENRTVTLDKIPTQPCKMCSCLSWAKTSMMDERKTKVSGPKLCIRGGEEKFIGSMVTDANLNLHVPESN